jgi:hypothetical protein
MDAKLFLRLVKSRHSVKVRRFVLAALYALAFAISIRSARSSFARSIQDARHTDWSFNRLHITARAFNALAHARWRHRTKSLRIVRAFRIRSARRSADERLSFARRA